MTVAFIAEAPPLAMDEHGAIRVAGTRLTLETVVDAFDAGASAEEIVDQYDVLSLPDAYSVISYILHHREEVDAYMAERDRLGEEIRKEVERRFPQEGLRAKLLARRQAKGHAP